MSSITQRCLWALTVVGLHAGVVNPAFAQEARWDATCRVGSHTFTLGFDSASGDPFEDDMRATLKADGETRVAPLDAKLYMPTPFTEDSQSICDTTAALAIDDDAAMVFVSVDDRPGLPIVIGFVVDAKDRRVFAPSALARTMEPVELKPFYMRMHAQQARNTKNRKSDGPDAYFFAYRRFSLNARSLLARWETPPPRYGMLVPLPVLAGR